MKYINNSNFGIGFERFFTEFEQALAVGPALSYPPHNIVRIGNEGNEFLVELAVAGFSGNELNIEVKNNTLTITGKKTDKDERNYSHKGIGTRAFERSFKLAEQVIVENATLANGILGVSLKLEIPEEKKPRNIAIEY